MSQFLNSDDGPAPSFVPISLRITADHFLSGPTNITLTVTPSSDGIINMVPPDSLSFYFRFYTLGTIAMNAVGYSAQLVPLPNPTHYFANVPASLQVYGDNAMCTISCLQAITELKGQTLVIVASSNSEDHPTNTAVATIPVIDIPSKR